MTQDNGLADFEAIKRSLVAFAEQTEKRRDEIETEYQREKTALDERFSERRSATREEARHARNALKALDPTHPMVQPAAGKPKKQTPGSSYNGNVKPDMMDEIVAWLGKQGEEPFTVPELLAATDISEPTVRRAIERLREGEGILLAGTKSAFAPSGKKVGKPRAYRVASMDEVDAAVARNRAQYEERKGGVVSG